MTELHYELTDETMVNDQGVTLYRIRYTKDHPNYKYSNGALGGWLETELAVGEPVLGVNTQLWGEAQVFGRARLMDESMAENNVQIFGGARLYDTSTVWDNAKVYGGVYLTGESCAYDNAEIFMDSTLRSESFGGHAHISKDSDFLKVSSIGSESVEAKVVRTRTGHNIKVGCWNSDNIDDLLPEVYRRRATFWKHASEDLQNIWQAQYEALHAMATATVSQWK